MRAMEVIGKGEEMHGRLYVKVSKEEVRETIEKLRRNGFNHFVMLSCIDWIDEGEFELIYHLWSYEQREHVMISTRIKRDGEEMESLHDLFPQIETYEREIKEMFGINFVGNNRLTPFLLEGWPHMPPMRKDFDSKKFTKDVFESIPPVEDEDEGI